jgi:hypothetical protein
MFLGACLDLGMPLQVLEEAVAGLGLEGVTVESRRARRGGVEGIRFRVLKDGAPIEGRDPDEPPGAGHPAHDHGAGREHRDIRRLLERSALAPAVRDRAIAMFARLAEVEGAIHGVPPERVHFHEVGAIDSIVDIAGACTAFEHFGGRFTCGTVVTGSGTVSTAHGVLPVPSPATAALLVGIPIVGGGEGELLTPTGALILAQLMTSFGPAPAMVPLRHGYGLGRWDPAGRANVARLTQGRPAEDPAAEVTVIECQVDDLPGEGAGFALERLLEAGALDVYFTAVQMKKSRPGILVTVLCRPAQAEALAGVLLEETGSLGCRYHRAARLEAERRVVKVATDFGPVRVKVGTFAGKELAAAPEFEDCRRLAREHGVTWREVHRAAVVARSEGRDEEGR